MARKVDIDSELDNNNSFNDERGGMPAQKRRTAPGLKPLLLSWLSSPCASLASLFTRTHAKRRTRPKLTAVIK